METHRLWNDKIDMSAKTGYVKKPLRVILDSNALFVPIQFKIDIFKELEKLLNRNIELILLSSTRREIERLAQEGTPKMRKDASFVLKLAEKCKVVEISYKNHTAPDDIIVEVARERNFPVFTNDALLRKRLRDINVPVIYVRQKSRLDLDGRL